MNAQQVAAIDKAARERAERWLAGRQLPEPIQRRIRPLLISRLAVNKRVA